MDVSPVSTISYVKDFKQAILEQPLVSGCVGFQEYDTMTKQHPRAQFVAHVVLMVD